VALRIVDLIARKRDGGELSAEEIGAVVDPHVPDYQLAAFLMAVVLRGLSDRETADLLEAMVDSGKRIDLSPVGRPVADKHSTGGVGDKTTLVIAPIVAAAGTPVAKLSGRGLGHTGGTLDKLESIPGFRVDLSIPEFVAQVAEHGVAVAAQSADIVPADKRLYTLRDVTATVQSIPLIAASIMSKKIAAGASRLVLDVKVGEGAFMEDLDSARALSQAMMRLGETAGLPTTCMLSSMDEPLGCAVGNALEVAEAVATLEGRGPAEFTELCLVAAGLMLGDRGAADAALHSGRALDAYRKWIAAQGGDPSASLPRAPDVTEVRADRSGVVARSHSRAIADAAMRLGAGRARKEDAVDHAVGIVVHRKRGDAVAAGDVLATVHSRGPVDEAAVRESFELADGEVEKEPVVLEILRPDGPEARA
jgi:pyrimidine-nucleoside phosphorylase